MTYALSQGTESNRDINKLTMDDKSVHRWYRFVLSFPPHFVRTYVSKFDLGVGAVVLDPFCGTGTSLVECKKLGIDSIGIEAHPMAHFAAQVKVNWVVDIDQLRQRADSIATRVLAEYSNQGIQDESTPITRCNRALKGLPSEQSQLLLKDSISALPLHKALILREFIESEKGSLEHPYLQLALAKALVNNVSNLHFGPEVGVREIKKDTAIVQPWLANINDMCEDINLMAPRMAGKATIIKGDARDLFSTLRPKSIDAVLTSPPYPNEKDYTRTTRLESVLLGMIRDRTELREMKQTILRSNTRNVYKDDNDDIWIRPGSLVYDEIRRLACEIEERRVSLKKTSGFERLYGRVTRLYFGGIARHLSTLRPVLRHGAQLAYVVGDQASYLGVMIQTGQIVARIAEQLGYQVDGIDLFRTRRATHTKQDLREEVVLLRWRGFR